METLLSFNYTSSFLNLNSSVVQNVFYNENSKQLLVALQSGEAYCYKNVPKELFEDFGTGMSKGVVYNAVKHTYGPAAWHAPGVEVHCYSVRRVPTALKEVFDGTQTPNRRQHDVTFKINGNVRTHTLQATSVDEAVASVEQIADIMGVSMTVQKVTVHFE